MKLKNVGLETAIRILNKWGLPDQLMRILQISDTYFNDPSGATLTQDHIERISYLLNIHATLRTVFENPENVYGFMSLKNNNPSFNGKTPLELIGTGRLEDLRNVYQRIHGLTLS